MRLNFYQKPFSSLQISSSIQKSKNPYKNNGLNNMLDSHEKS